MMTYLRAAIVIAFLAAFGNASATTCTYWLRAEKSDFWSHENRDPQVKAAFTTKPQGGPADIGFWKCLENAIQLAPKLGTKQVEFVFGAIEFVFELDNSKWSGWILDNTTGRSKVVSKCLNQSLEPLVTGTLLEEMEQDGFGTGCPSRYVSLVHSFHRTEYLIEATVSKK